MQPLLRRKLRSPSRKEEMTVVIKIYRLDFRTTFHNNTINIVCPWFPWHVRTYSSSPHINKIGLFPWPSAKISKALALPIIFSAPWAPHPERLRKQVPSYPRHRSQGRRDPEVALWSAGLWSLMTLSVPRAHLWHPSVWDGEPVLFY